MTTEIERHHDINPFGDNTTALALQQTGGMQVVAREESEAKAFIALSRMNPRSQPQAWTMIKAACERPTFAEKARYAFPRGGATVMGPSVNMAREIGRCWTNVRYGLRMVSVDDEYVHIKGWCHDGESNLYVEAEDRFKKKIQRKIKGTNQTQWLEPDERDLRELVNRRGALLIRNCILQVIPADIVEEAMTQVAATIKKAAAGDISKDRRGTIRAIAANFGEFGITVAMLEERLGHPLDTVTPDEVAELRSMFASLKDGHETRDSLFGTTKATAGTPDAKPEAPKSKVERMAAATKAPDQPIPAVPDPVATTDVPEALATPKEVDDAATGLLLLPKPVADAIKKQFGITGKPSEALKTWRAADVRDLMAEIEGAKLAQ